MSTVCLLLPWVCILNRLNAAFNAQISCAHSRQETPAASVQGEDFDRTGSLMSGTLRRLDGLLRGGGGQSHMCYLICFVVAIFLLLWWLVSKR